MTPLSRREFLVTAGAAVVLAPTLRAAAQITVGYAAITWGGNDVQAIEDVSSLGYKGIQLRSSAVDKFGDKPAELKAILEKHALRMAVLSSGNIRLDPAFESADLEKHSSNARFVKALGGEHLQVIDEPPKGKALVPDDYKRMGRLLTELGKRTADAGIPLVYHNHMNSMSEPPDGTARIMDASDPKVVHLLLDVAHYQQGGGDPIAAISTYKDRIKVMHIKDVVSPGPPADNGQPRAYQFVELGRGKVPLPQVKTALDTIGFKGWAIVELDSVPDKGKTPKDCAAANRDYVRQQLHLTI
jgi:inosose dehydratase